MLTFGLVLVLVRQVIGSGPSDQLHVGGSVNLEGRKRKRLVVASCC